MTSRFDYITLFLVTILVCIGMLAIYSASSFTGTGGAEYFNRQALWAVLGFSIMISVGFLPAKTLQQISYSFYAFMIVTLIYVLFFGKVGKGAERWIAIGSVHFQPSEFAKLATIMAVSSFLSEKYADVNRLKYFSGAVGLILLPFLLIARQPDLGTAMVFLAIIIPLLYWAGLHWFYIFVIVTPLLTMLLSFNFVAFLILMLLIVLVLILSRKKPIVLVAVFLMNIIVGIVTPTIWGQLRPYQQQRIMTFMNPEKDPQGAGYQIIQSQVAIGSGGFWGKGYLKGSQTHLRFLPAQHTDFIFSVIGEEFGFFGVSIVLFFLFLLIVRLIHLASTMKNGFASMTIIGIATVLGFHVFINIGMTIGLAPVTGLPLPFISYGGSFLLANLLMMGVVMNIAGKRFEF